MNLKRAVAAACMVVAGAAQAAGGITGPGGNLGSLEATPSLFGALTFVPEAQEFTLSYGFDVSAVSDLFGSLGIWPSLPGVELSPLTFIEVLVDNQVATTVFSSDLGLGFKLDDVAVGAHTLTVRGVFGQGVSGYLGSVYATQAAAVPEPGSLALVLAGAGIVAGVSLRRRKA